MAHLAALDWSSVLTGALAVAVLGFLLLSRGRS